MANDRYERIDYIRSVERQYLVVSAAMERLAIAVADGRDVMPPNTSVRDLVASRRQLEATFLIRMWAEFESAVRSYHGWLQNDPSPRVRAIDLVNSVFAGRHGRAVLDRVRTEVHEVREYRNALVHDRDEVVLPVELSEARRRLNVYLGTKLPERWG